MPRTKSLATLFEHYGDERVFKPRAIKIPSVYNCLLYTSPSPRDLSTSRMPSSA